MRLAWFCICLLSGFFAEAQQPVARSKKMLPPDSLTIEWKDGIADELPVLAVENEKADASIQYLPSLLSASRDLFSNTASFHFGLLRFRPRGYDARWSAALINGLPMQSAADGQTPWAYWSGLNDVTKNMQSVNGLRAGDMDMGNPGSTTLIDMRAFKQKQETQIGYSFSNRSYTHRISFTYTPSAIRHGWNSSFSGSMRYAEEGMVPGAGLSGASYYLGIDKRIHDDVLSMVIFGAITKNDRSSPVLQETVDLARSAQYNPNWGYLSGKKRNANQSAAHIPVAIFSFDHRIDNHRALLLSAGIMAGEKTATALDWYNAADPRPDYYKYLPSYQNDSVLRMRLTELYESDPSLLQINWNRLYEVNRNSFAITRDADGISGNIFGGLRSHYILQRKITALQRLVLNCVYNSLPAKDLHLVSGFTVQWQRNHFYKRIEDLLGGEYYVDWNQFAEGDGAVIQNDLEHPNRILKKGDRYGYNYVSLTTQLSGWVQLNTTKKRIDAFIALQAGYTNFLRDGLIRTGLFPDNSFGRSVLQEFGEYHCKAGLTWKLSGRKYIYLHGAMLSKAPLFSDVFLSPETRDTEQESVNNEKIISAEAGYILNAPSVKWRLTGYLTQFSDEMNVLSFYHDGYRSFVNYALSGIGHMHVGIETGMELRIHPTLSLNAVAAIGRYYYNARPSVAVSIDNDDYITERGTIYLKNYNLGGMPQQAFSLGFAYQSPKYFYLNLTASYLRKQWIELNPYRRTETVLQSAMPGSVQWNTILQQTLLPDQYTVDISAGNSFRLKMGAKRRTLALYAGISNLLNNQKLLAGGFEQLRFDPAEPGKFPPKFFYAGGLQYSVNLSLR
ncbi:MAG: TonB-dependent receptor [Chitinophagaceae bacterium]|nr:TonB-dependent receptor [Chitinophagaceae bacterium]